MELLKDKLKNLKYKVEIKQGSVEKRPATEWQELASELTAYFHQNCYWIPWKFPLYKIREKFKAIQDLPKEKRTLTFFIGMLKK